MSQTSNNQLIVGRGKTSRVEVLGVSVSQLTTDSLLETIEHTIRDKRRIIIAHVNVHGMNLSYEQPWFRTFLNQSGLVVCDGFGVKWGAWMLGQHLPERFTHADWIPKLAALCARKGFSMYFLGAKPGIAQRAATRLQDKFCELPVAGTHHGYFDKTIGSKENESVLQAINEARPNILGVGFGMPIQERWVMENWERLDANIVITGGAMFDYLAGRTLRGPRWMTDRGLEWLARLVIEPRRLWRRYLIGNPLFLWRILRWRFGRAPAND